MKIIKVADKLGAKDLEFVLNELMAGEVIMHPTETCYGLAVDIFQEEALQRLYALKKMSWQKPVSIMVSDLAMAQEYAYFNEKALALAEQFWPGPLTLVLPRKESLPDFLNAGHATVGVRCPASALSQQFIKSYGGPLSTTSANISGIKEVYNIKGYLEQLRLEHNGLVQLEPAVIIDAGDIPKNPPSTLVGFSDDGTIQILRQGSLFLT